MSSLINPSNAKKDTDAKRTRRKTPLIKNGEKEILTAMKPQNNQPASQINP